MVILRADGLNKKYKNKSILEDVSFEIKSGTFSVIFGPPGCGKSVLLRVLSGLEKPDSGRVFLRGEDVTNVISGDRNIGYVPQAFALYPHYTVYDNIAYPLKLVRESKRRIAEEVDRVAKMLRITHLLNKYPDQLSGGEKQRVALARGITKKTELYFLDDPLSGLDFKLREQLFDDLKDLRERLGATFVYTTSDPLEALILADEIFILDEKTVKEHGETENVYYNPRYVGTSKLLCFPEANIFEGKIRKEGDTYICNTDLFEFPVEVKDEIESYVDVLVSVKPQNIIINEKPKARAIEIDGKLILTEDLGGELVLHIEVKDTLLVSVLRYEEVAKSQKEALRVYIPVNEIHVFMASTGMRIGRGGAYA